MNPEKGKKTLLYYLAVASMELSFLMALLLFINRVQPISFPLGSGLSAYLLGFFLGHFPGFTFRWQSFLAYLFALFFLMLPLLYPMQIILRDSQGVLWGLESNQIWPLLLLLLYVILLLFRGRSLSQRSTDYSSTSSHFDLGVLLFFLLFLMEGMGRMEGLEILSQGFSFPPFPFLALFFLSSFLAITLSRGETAAQGEGGGSLFFAALILLLLVGLFSTATPLLLEGSQQGYGVLKAVGTYIYPALLAVLRFLFHGLQVEKGGEIQPFLERDPVIRGETQAGGGESPLFAYLFAGLFCILMVVLLGWLVWSFIQWLSSPMEKKKRDWSFQNSILYRWWRSLQKKWKGKAQEKTPYWLFTYLLLWGRRSGCPKGPGETPGDYGKRLKKLFPPLEAELETLITLYQQEAFGGIPQKEEEKTCQKRLYLALKKPGLWPRRLYHRFFTLD